ncbi:hypothetical protein SAY87_016391 [Trapa incisa]|uniref:Uncharacterized protein n=1 Tax=Trapa incisa TaxID=236973 RepID=A0AAN7L8G8_9MYRT|nr:hypothetical protein SAY87_016391 [Trapa incisa]
MQKITATLATDHPCCGGVIVREKKHSNETTITDMGWWKGMSLWGTPCTFT